MVDASKARQRQDAERGLAKAQPWVRRLWEEDQGEKCWGYVEYVDLEVDDGERLEEYLVRRDAALFHATGAVGCGSTIGDRWRLQRFDWPGAAGHDEKSEDEGLAAKFERLRERFKSVPDRAPKKQRIGVDVRAESGGLLDEILRNVFLVIDHDCVNSVLSGAGSVDDMWVWAVDPDYKAGAALTKDDQKDEYKGHLRVRLQQLVNNFFDARRFQEDDYSMKALWEAAQKTRNKAFVSVNDAEAGLWKMSRDVGSALRPQR